MIRIIVSHILLPVVFATNIHAKNQADSEDTTRIDGVPEAGSASVKFNTRLNSAGLFNFSGRICNDHPAFDASMQLEQRSFGCSVFAAVDLYDTGSANNFLFGLFYKKFSVSEHLTITPYSGFILAEWGKEKGDRQILITSLKLSRQVTVDHTALLSNFLSAEEKDFVNRLRLIFLPNKHISCIWSVWHNNRMFDTHGYTSSALQAFYSQVKVTDTIMLSTGVTLLVMARTTHENVFPKNNGIVFTIAATIQPAEADKKKP